MKVFAAVVALLLAPGALASDACVERLDGLLCPHGEAPATAGLVPVAFAARDLPPGHTLSQSDIVWVGLPKDMVVKDTLGPRVLGRKVIDGILADEVLRGERLAPSDTAAELPPPKSELVRDKPTPRPDARPAPAGLTVMVIVAGRELAAGTVIAEADLYAVEIAPRHLPQGVYLSPEHVVGRAVASRVLANEFVRSSRLADVPATPVP